MRFSRRRSVFVRWLSGGLCFGIDYRGNTNSRHFCLFNRLWRPEGVEQISVGERARVPAGCWGAARGVNKVERDATRTRRTRVFSIKIGSRSQLSDMQALSSFRALKGHRAEAQV